MEFKGTKGPWQVEKMTEFKSTGKECTLGIKQMDVEWYNAFTPICMISPISKANKQDKYNAQLISKAPEMLEAILTFCEQSKKQGITNSKTYKKFRKLIKEATTIKRKS